MRTWKSFGVVDPARTEEQGVLRVTSVWEGEHSLRMSGYKRGDYSTLKLIEDPDGIYRGWVKHSKPESIIMVQHKQIFPIQFPYGIESEVAQGEGEVVSLRIEVDDIV